MYFILRERGGRREDELFFVLMMLIVTIEVLMVVDIYRVFVVFLVRCLVL